jgi:hypothetical protein
MANHIETILTGGIAQGTILMADSIPMDSGDVQNIGQLIIQIIVGIVTVWKLVKKPKPKKDGNQNFN